MSSAARMNDVVHATAAAMRAAGLTQAYDTALETGWRPSQSVLPPELRRLAIA